MFNVFLCIHVRLFCLISSLDSEIINLSTFADLAKCSFCFIQTFRVRMLCQL